MGVSAKKCEKVDAPREKGSPRAPSPRALSPPSRPRGPHARPSPLVWRGCGRAAGRRGGRGRRGTARHGRRLSRCQSALRPLPTLTKRRRRSRIIVHHPKRRPRPKERQRRQRGRRRRDRQLRQRRRWRRGAAATAGAARAVGAGAPRRGGTAAAPPPGGGRGAGAGGGQGKGGRERGGEEAGVQGGQLLQPRQVGHQVRARRQAVVGELARAGEGGGDGGHVFGRAMGSERDCARGGRRLASLRVASGRAKAGGRRKEVHTRVRVGCGGRARLRGRRKTGESVVPFFCFR